MPKQNINYGANANDTNADSIRSAFQKSKENFDELYAIKADADATLAALADKADFDQTSAALALKANIADVTASLGAKANTSDVNSALALKANASALAGKANASDLDAKADLVDGKVPASQLPAASNAVSSVNDKTGAVVLNKADVGLGNVDNTSDAAKPISDATATALALKADATALAAKANNSDLLNKASVGALAHLIPNMFGATDSNMKWIKRAFARLRAGTGRIRFGIIGDSTSAISSGSDFSKSWPVQFLTELLVHGFGPINREAINLGYSDTRVSGGTGWGRSYNQSIGNSTTTNPLVVTPNGTGDTIDFWYIPDSAASFTYSLNGGAAVTVPVNAATDGAAIKISVPCGSVGAHSISFSRVSGYVVLSSLEFYTAGVPDISAHIRGFAGSKIADWCKSTVAGYGSYGIPSRAIRGLNCDLNIVMLGINDVDQAVPLATSQTQLSAIIDDLKAMNSDVILMTFHPCNSANTIANQVAFNDMVRALAATKGIPLIDLFAHHVSYAQAQAMSYTSDNLHYNDNGKAEEAAFIATSVLKAAGRL